MTSYPDFTGLPRADLVLDCVYEGGPNKNIGADPLAKLLPVGNQGGFRFNGRPVLGDCKMVVLFTTGAEEDWPDALDGQTGQFVYYGDNRQPGSALHETKRGGNRLLAQVFEALHATPPRRELIPPFFVFERHGTSRDVRFRGVAVPGAYGTSPLEDLVAVWKSKGSQRFQNYKAVFTILDCPMISRSWVDSVTRGQPHHPNAPTAWAEWVATGRYRPLEAVPVRSFRLPREQLPQDEAGRAILEATYRHFKSSPHAFEPCAARLWQMVSPSATVDEITRPSRDGGRDAIGRLTLGPRIDPISLSYALEAKCYSPTHGASVSDTARLVSRLRHREFGVFVTTSYVGTQAYQEIREDNHPVVIMAGVDVVNLLKSRQIGTPDAARQWLAAQFPLS